RNADQTDPDPSLLVAFNAAARKRWSRFRIGPALSVRLSDNMNYGGYAGAGVLAYELPKLHRRLDAELSGEVGGMDLTAIPARPGLGSPEKHSFWSALGAAQLSLGLAFSPNLEALVSARVEGAPLRSVQRQADYCDFFQCQSVVETWRVGGIGYGVNL